MTPQLHGRPPDCVAPRDTSGELDSASPAARADRGAGGGAAVTGRAAPVTSGEPGGTNGWTAARVTLAGFAVWAALLTIQVVVNALSQVSENPARPSWPYWTWEVSSMVGWLCVAPLLWQLVRRLPRLARRPGLLLAALAAASVALSLAHVAIMFGLRFAIYPLLAETYAPTRGLADTLLYEYRKDVSTLLQMGVLFYGIQWLAAHLPFWNGPANGAAPEPRTELVVEVQDGPSTHFVPLGEIDQASAAGNYVEIAWRGRKLLHRTTLAALEAAWAPHGFARIHRGTLIRTAAVVRVETLKTGDFLAELADGTLLRGSRRYRAALDGGP